MLLSLPFQATATADVPYVALGDLPVIPLIDVADEFNLGWLTAFGFERQVVVADVAVPLQFSKRGFVGGGVAKQANLPQFLADELVCRVTRQLGHERVGFEDSSAVGIKNEHSVFGGLEEPTVQGFRSVQLLLGDDARGDVDEVADHAVLTIGQRHAMNLPVVVFTHFSVVSLLGESRGCVRLTGFEGVPEPPDNVVGAVARPHEADDFDEVSADQIPDAAEDRASLLVHQTETHLCIHQVDAHWRGIEECLESGIVCLLRYLQPFVFGDVASDFRGTDNLPSFVCEGRHRHRNVDQRAVFLLTYGFVVLGGPSAANLVKNGIMFVEPIRRYERPYGLTDHFVLGVTKEQFRTPVPTGNDTVEVLGEDGISRRRDHRGQMRHRRFGAFALGDVLHRQQDPFGLLPWVQDGPGVEQHGAAAQLLEVVLDLEAFDGFALRQDLLE